MKTLEFKLNLTAQQEAKINEWLSASVWIWNCGLALIEWCKYWEKYQKCLEIPSESISHWGFTDIPLVPIRYHKNEINVFEKRTKGGIKTKTIAEWGLCCDLVVGIKVDENTPPITSTEFEETRDGNTYRYRPGVTLLAKLHWQEEPPLKPHGKDPYFSLTGFFTQKNHLDKPWFTAVPKVFAQGVCRTLASAWKAYKDNKRKRPKYKKKQSIKTLANNNTKETKKDAGDNKVQVNAFKVELDKERITIPKLDFVKIKGLRERWGNTLIDSYTITKYASGYYIQLTGRFDFSKLKPSDKALGLDVGTTNLYAKDNGKTIKPREYYQKLSKQITRIQRKIARQKKKSANQQKSYERLAKTHETIRRKRRAFNHKLSTKLVREYGAIAVEDIKLTNLNRRPHPKKRDGAKGYEHNGAKRKSALNKDFADAGIGQLLTMIEEKVKAVNPDQKLIGSDCKREFVRVPPHYTSQTCSKCGHCESGNRPTQANFICLKCGYTDHADSNAAKNILKRGKKVFLGSYRTWVWEVKPEREQTVSVGDDVPTGESETPRSKTVKQETTVVVPSAELCTPTFDYSSDSRCGNQEVYKNCNTENQPENDATSSVEASQLPKKVAAKPETLADTGLEPLLNRKQKRRKSVPGSQNKRGANCTLGIQLALDLWGSALEISSEDD